MKTKKNTKPESKKSEMKNHHRRAQAKKKKGLSNSERAEKDEETLHFKRAD